MGSIRRTTFTKPLPPGATRFGNRDAAEDDADQPRGSLNARWRRKVRRLETALSAPTTS